MARSKATPTATVAEEQPQLPVKAPQQQKSRIGRRTVTGRVDPPIARAVAVLAATQDRTQEDLLTEALRDLLAKYEQPLVNG